MPQAAVFELNRLRALSKEVDVNLFVFLLFNQGLTVSLKLSMAAAAA